MAMLSSQHEVSSRPPALAVHAGAAFAQYKCTSAAGAVTFQQTPCFGAQSEEKLVVMPNGHPPAASGASAPPVIVQTAASASVGKPQSNIDKRMLAGYEKQHQRDRSSRRSGARRTTRRRRARSTPRPWPRRDGRSATIRERPALNDGIGGDQQPLPGDAELDHSRIRAAQAALDDWDQAKAAAKAGATSEAPKLCGSGLARLAAARPSTISQPVQARSSESPAGVSSVAVPPARISQRHTPLAERAVPRT